MNTKDEKAKDPYNTAMAAIMRAQKAELRLTFPALEVATGIKLRQLKALLNDDVSLRVGDFYKLTAALGLNPVVVVQDAAARVENTAA